MSTFKIVTWYGHLRDTFAGKIQTTFSQLGRGPKFLSLILPAKVSRNLTDFSFITKPIVPLPLPRTMLVHLVNLAAFCFHVPPYIA